MQIKNKQMEFTSKQNNELQQMKDFCKLQQLQKKYDNVKEELATLITKRSESLSEREALVERVKSLQEEIEKASQEVYNRQRKLEDANKTFVYHDNEHLQSLCILLGYQISKFKLLENNGIQITLCYRNSCFVTYSEIAEVFDLVEIHPQHHNFSHIKEFLRDSQDLRGLLSCLRKFFDVILVCQDKQEQN